MSRTTTTQSVITRIWPPARSRYRAAVELNLLRTAEVEDIIYHGRGDVARHGRHEPRCESALGLQGETYRCDLYADHNGWAHSSFAAKAIWQ